MTSRPQRFGLVAKVWIVYCVLGVVLDAVSGYKQSLAVFSRIRPLQALEDLGMLIVVVSITFGLMKLHPLFQWWVGRLFKAKTFMNINLLPVFVPVIGPIFLVLLAFVLPQVCTFEEQLFRQGTTSWGDAIVRSLIFGAVHLLVGVPLGAAIGISVAGMWLTLCYFEGGVALSSVHHTTYDLIAVAFLALALSLDYLARRRQAATGTPAVALSAVKEPGPLGL